MKSIGITGGIGSGKTFISKIFEKLDIPVYNADTRARFLIENDNLIISKIISKFGIESYNQNKLNVKHVSSIVFNSKEKLNDLNNIVHPQVYIDYKNWMSTFKNKKFVLHESALLLNSKEYFDKIILVFAPIELRIKRACMRDNKMENDIILKINNQATEKEFQNAADYTLINDGRPVLKQIINLYNTINDL